MVYRRVLIRGLMWHRVRRSLPDAFHRRRGAGRPIRARCMPMPGVRSGCCLRTRRWGGCVCSATAAVRYASTRRCRGCLVLHGTATQQPHPAHPREYTFPDCRAYTPAMPARSLHIPLSAKFQTLTTPQSPHRRRHCGTMPQNPLSSPTALPTSPTPDGGLSPRPDGGGRPRLASKHQLHHVRCSTRAVYARQSGKVYSRGCAG